MTDTCAAVHPDRPGYVCDRPSGHTQPHRATTGALPTLWPRERSQPLTAAHSGSAVPDWPEDYATVADLITSHAQLRDQVHQLRRLLDDAQAEQLRASRRVGRLRGELWTLRHLAKRRTIMPGRAVVQRVDRILNHDQQAAS